MVRRTTLVACLFASLIGCSPASPAIDRPAPPASATSTPWSPRPEEDSAAGNACREEVANLEDWLKGIEAAGQPVTLSQLDKANRLVERVAGPVAEAAPLLHIKRDELLLNGVLVKAGGVKAGLSKLIELRGSMTPKSPFSGTPLCHFAIDKDARWAAVAQALEEAVAAGVTRVTFVFRNPKGKLPSIPPSAIDPDLARLRSSAPTKKQQVIAELLAYVYQDCPEGLKVIAKMGANELAEFKQVTMAELPQAIGACRCAPEAASVKALHWEVFGQPRPVAGISVRLASPKRPQRTTILLAPDVDWGTASASLDGVSAEAMQPVHFGVLEGPPLDNTAAASASPTP